VTNGVTEILTIGHSTHQSEHFLELLRLHDVRQLADVRTVPRSRRHPQFGRDNLDNFLRGEGITYRHFPSLGGLRKPRPNSVNTAWQNPSFRGYADHMQTEEFGRGLSDLLAFARDGTTAAMCAEAVWWECHRRLLADALLAHGVPVRHILPNGDAKAHRMSEFGQMCGSAVSYPGLL
jgi:uncharacterized protein (DUF488 family)